MAVGKEIRNKITSVKNTQKITRAMEMVAASKLRKTQDRMNAAKPYAESIRRVIGHLSQAGPDFHNPYLETREVKRVGYLVVTTDRGLCGSLNVNLFRALINDIGRWRDQGVEADLCILGAKGLAFFRRLNTNVVSAATHLGDVPKVADLVGPITTMTDAYKEGTIDQVFLAYNAFVNTMTQRPTISTLVPVAPVTPKICRTIGTTSTNRMPRSCCAMFWSGIWKRRSTAARSRTSPVRCVQDGGDEGGHGQRGEIHRSASTGLQQGPPSGDHSGDIGNRRRAAAV